MNILCREQDKFLANQFATEYKSKIIILNIEFFQNNERKAPTYSEQLNDNNPLSKQIYNDINDIPQKPCLLIFSFGHNIDSEMMDLLFLIHSLKIVTTEKISVFLPFLPYSRQNKRKDLFHLSLILNLMLAARVDDIITIDIHHKENYGKFYNLIRHIELTDIFKDILPQFHNHLVISPDRGGIYRAAQVAQEINTTYIGFYKTRDKNNKIVLNMLNKADSSKIPSRRCLIVDDILDSGDTLLHTIKNLHNMGATEINAIITHPVLLITKAADSIFQQLMESPLANLYLSNSLSSCSNRPGNNNDAISQRYNKIKFVNLEDIDITKILQSKV